MGPPPASAHLLAGWGWAAGQAGAEALQCGAAWTGEKLMEHLPQKQGVTFGGGREGPDRPRAGQERRVPEQTWQSKQWPILSISMYAMALETGGLCKVEVFQGAPLSLPDPWGQVPLPFLRQCLNPPEPQFPHL